MRPRILIIGDDDAVRRSLAEQLERHAEFACVECPDIASALETAGAAPCDAVLLDDDAGDARELCLRLRRAAPRAAIIALTDADGCGESFAGIADDCISKPIRLSVLLDRLRERLQPPELRLRPAATIGPFDFRAGAKLLIEPQTDRRIRLTEKETAILDYLLRAGGRVIDRETLLAAVWGYRTAVTTHTLETHVYRLRQKIEGDPAQARILVTEAGGYRLVA